MVSGLDISGTITVNANNVTIKNTRVTGVAGANSLFLVVFNNSGNLTITDTEFTASSPNSVQHAVRSDSGGTLMMTRVYQHGTIDSLCYCGQDSAGPSVANIQDSYSKISLAIPGDHLENIYTDDSTLTLNHSTLYNDQPQTANVFGNTNNGFGGACVNHFTITNNLFAGGGFTLDLCAHGTLGTLYP